MSDKVKTLQTCDGNKMTKLSEIKAEDILVDWFEVKESWEKEHGSLTYSNFKYLTQNQLYPWISKYTSRISYENILTIEAQLNLGAFLHHFAAVLTKEDFLRDYNWLTHVLHCGEFSPAYRGTLERYQMCNFTKLKAFKVGSLIAHRMLRCDLIWEHEKSEKLPIDAICMFLDAWTSNNEVILKLLWNKKVGFVRCPGQTYKFAFIPMEGNEK